MREKEVTEMEKYQFLLDKIGLVVPLGEILEGWQSNKPPEREREKSETCGVLKKMRER